MPINFLGSSGGGGGAGLASARVIVVDKTTTADADETTIGAGITAAAALSPTPSTTAPALVYVRDAAVYTEDLTTAVGIHVIAPSAIINGAHTLARESSIEALQFGDKGSGTAPMFQGDGGVSGQRRAIAQTIEAATSASRPVVGVASNSEFGEILVTCRDYKASLAPTISVGSSVSFGNLSLGFICDRLQHQATISTYVHIDCDSTVATTRCHFEARATRDGGSLDSTGGLFQIAGGIHTIDMATVPFKSGGTNLLATITGGTLGGRIGRVENWNTPNAISGSGSFEVAIGNLTDLGWSHPLLSQHASDLVHYWPLDDASTTQTDDAGSADLTLTSAFHGLPGPNADGSRGSTGRKAVGFDTGTSSYATTAALGAGISGSYAHSRWMLFGTTADNLVPDAFGISTVTPATAVQTCTFDGTRDLTIESTGAADVARGDQCADIGRWVHVFFSRNSSTGAYCFAIDGEVVDEGTGWDTTDLAALGYQISTLRASGSTLGGPDMRIAESRVWDVYINDADVIRQMARTF